MKKKIVNKHVIRAISIGLSAVMATTPITALAAEPDTTPDVPDGTESDKTTPTAAEEVANAQAAVPATETAVVTADDKENNVADIVADATLPSGDEVAPAAEALENTASDTDGNNIAVSDVANAEDDLSDVADAVTNTDTALANAETEVNTASGIATILDGDITTAQTAIDEQQALIQGASTVADAQAAYAAAEAVAKEAQEKVDAAQEAFEEAETRYNNAVADVNRFDGEYQAAVDAALADLEAAEENLKDVKEKSKDLNDKAVAARENYKEQAETEAVKAAVEILKMEKERAEDASTKWKELDKLFYAIVNDYYFGARVAGQNITLEKVMPYTEYENGEHNFSEVIYTEDGVKKSCFLNYKLNAKTDQLVIFEKQLEVITTIEVAKDKPGGKEVFFAGDTRYSKEELEAAKDAGKIMKLSSGEYVELGDEISTTLNTLVTETSEADLATATEEVSIDETTEQVSYAKDDEGNLVKTVKADVTTVTYTSNSLAGGAGFATAAEAEAAAKAELDEKDKNLNVTVQADTEVSYESEATVTYLPTFSLKIDLAGMDLSGTYEDADEAKDKAGDYKKNAQNYLENNYYDGDLSLDGLGVEQTGENDWDETVQKEFLFWEWEEDVHHSVDDPYKITSGTITGTFREVRNIDFKQSVWDGGWFEDWFGTGKSPSDIQADVEKELNGGKFIEDIDSGNAWDGAWRKGNADYYVANQSKGSKVTAETQEAAEKAAIESAKEQAKNDLLARANQIAAAIASKLGISTDRVTVTGSVAEYRNDFQKVSKERKEKTTYSYSGTYLDYVGEETENQIISTVNVASQDIMAPTSNGNYTSTPKNILFDEYADEDFRNFLNKNKDIVDTYNAYDKIAKAAEEADAAVADAQDKVDKLQEKIESLKGKNSRISDLAALEAVLSQAMRVLEKAQEDNEDLQEKLEELAEDLVETIDRLTPPEAPAGGDDTTDDTTDVVIPPVAPAAPGAPVALAGQGGAGAGTILPAGANAGQGGNVEEVAGGAAIEEIEDEDVPLADKEDVDIQDEDVALASTPEMEKAKMSWWWLLIVALLGATGYEMYRRNQKKKELAAQTTDNETK